MVWIYTGAYTFSYKLFLLSTLCYCNKYALTYNNAYIRTDDFQQIKIVDDWCFVSSVETD